MRKDLGRMKDWRTVGRAGGKEGGRNGVKEGGNPGDKESEVIRGRLVKKRS
jgi:hypothetical protein